MNTNRSIRIAASSICAAAFLCAAAEVSAQTVYKHVTLAGGILYSDQPNPAPSSAEAATPEAEETNLPSKKFYVSPRLAAAVNANEAERRLRQAQLKRKQGMAPLPGEQTNGGHAGALNERYWRRQEKLRRLVDQAQLRLNATHRPQLAALAKSQM